MVLDREAFFGGLLNCLRKTSGVIIMISLLAVFQLPAAMRAVARTRAIRTNAARWGTAFSGDAAGGVQRLLPVMIGMVALLAGGASALSWADQPHEGSRSGVFIPNFSRETPPVWGSDGVRRSALFEPMRRIDGALDGFLSNASGQIFKIMRFTRPSPRMQRFARDQWWEIQLQSMQLQMGVIRQYGDPFLRDRLGQRLAEFQHVLNRLLVPLSHYPSMVMWQGSGFMPPMGVPLMGASAGMVPIPMVGGGMAMWGGTMAGGGMMSGVPYPPECPPLMWGGPTTPYPPSLQPVEPYPGQNEVVMLLQGRWEMVSVSDSDNPTEPVPPGVIFTFQDDTVALADCPAEPGIPYTVLGGGQALNVEISEDSSVTWQLLSLTGTEFVFEEGGDVFSFEHRGSCAP